MKYLILFIQLFLTTLPISSTASETENTDPVYTDIFTVSQVDIGARTRYETLYSTIYLTHLETGEVVVIYTLDTNIGLENLLGLNLVIREWIYCNCHEVAEFDGTGRFIDIDQNREVEFLGLYGPPLNDLIIKILSH